MSTWGDRLGVFDLETTGVDVDTSRIVSACIAVLDEDGGVVSRWNWLADPGIDIPEGASAVHGITTERAQQDGRQATLVIAEIVQTLRVLFDSGIPVTVYNAPYDLSLLDRECRRHGLSPLVEPGPVIDPLVIDKAVDRYRKGKRTLEVTATVYEVPLDDAHDAGADAIAAGRVALALLRRYPDELDISLEDLHGRQEVWHAEQAASFQEYLRSKRGDDSYVADPSWPLKPTIDTSSFVDTQPIPPLPPRRGNVPVLDFSATGVLALETSRGEASEADARRFTSRAERLSSEPVPPTPLPSAPAPSDDPFLDGDDGSEPAWIIEPSEVPLVIVDQGEAVAVESGSGSVSSESLTVTELVSSFPNRDRDLPDTDDTDVVDVPAEHASEGGGDSSWVAPDDSGAWVLDDTSTPEADDAEADHSEPDDTEPDDAEADGSEADGSEADGSERDDVERADFAGDEPQDQTGDIELGALELGPDSDQMAASDAVGEPEDEPSAPAGPPQAVLRIAAAIVTDPEGRCLLVRKAGTSAFMQPGGKLEAGESALDALARELQEELGLELDEASAEYLGVFRADAANEPHTLVSAAVFALETAEPVEARGEIEELLWIDDLDGLQLDLAPLTRDELLPLWFSRRTGAASF
jgi:DNA polymerase III epsilon subunit-like protein/8-oxo-dGTP pyrophosphatase MutT (NUDIX family)